MFGKTIPPIPFHSILFQTIQLSNLTNHSSPFYFFSTTFFNFPNPYTISLNLNHLYHLEIHKVKPFNIFFFSNHSKPFSNHFSYPKEWNGMGKMICPNKPIGSNTTQTDHINTPFTPICYTMQIQNHFNH